jgi:hypothetical protein
MSDLISNGVATIGGLIKSLTELLLAVVSLSIVSEVAFGSTIFGTSVVDNLTGIIGSIGGQNGLVGLIALLILVGILRK